jgi:hypothetical protein
LETNETRTRCRQRHSAITMTTVDHDRSPWATAVFSFHMFLIPYDRLCIDSPLTVDGVNSKISASVDTAGLRSFFLWAYASRTYCGRATSNGFLLIRSIKSWSRPYSLVRISAEPRGDGGALVRVVFLAPAFLILPVVLALFVAFPVGHSKYRVGLVFAAVYVLMWVFYRVEKDIVIADLRRLLTSESGK